MIDRIKSLPLLTVYFLLTSCTPPATVPVARTPVQSTPALVSEFAPTAALPSTPKDEPTTDIRKTSDKDMAVHQPQQRIATTPDPAPIQTSQLLGMDNARLREVIGPPQFIRRDRTAMIWRYQIDQCLVDLFLYPHKKGATTASQHYTVHYAHRRSTDNTDTACDG